jgi:hypothetical protein
MTASFKYAFNVDVVLGIAYSLRILVNIVLRSHKRNGGMVFYRQSGTATSCPLRPHDRREVGLLVGSHGIHW